MLVTEVVTATFALLVASAWGQEPEPLDRSHTSVEERETLETKPITHLLTMIERLQLQHDLEAAEDSHLSTYQHSGVQTEGDENGREPLTTLNSEESKRWKRKVIFRGGTYGGHNVRRSGAVGGDPWERRRHYGPGVGRDSWPHRNLNIPSVGMPMGGTSRRPTTTMRSDYVLITTTAPPPVVSPLTTAEVTPKSGDGSEDSKNSKSNQSMERATRKLTRNVKWEIAKYALQHGTDQAANRYENILGKRLPLKRIEKFIKKYQKQQKKAKGYHS